MKIIVGLGNLGKEYTETRHNVGFDFLDVLSHHPRLNAPGEKMVFTKNKKFQAEIVENQIAGEKYILVKPQTFMNLSGRSIRLILDFYKAATDDIIIISDDLDLPLGMARTRLSGSSGGHKGLQSIFDSLGTEKIRRLRIGIADKKVGGAESDHPYERPEAKEFVLEKFSSREQPIIEKMIQKSVDIIIDCLTGKEEFKATTIEA